MGNSDFAVVADYGQRDFEICFPDGTSLPAETEPKFRLIIKDETLAEELFGAPVSEVAAAEAFVDGRIEIEGDIRAAVRLAENLANWLGPTEEDGPSQRAAEPAVVSTAYEAQAHSGQTLDGDERRAAQLEGHLHSPERDRQAISFHYDLANEFFALWLDPRMVYSCAYFQQADDDLETAQLEKLDYICRKLRLEPGDRLLDIGCGWGALMIHAAERYGVEAVGVTLSEKQVELASERIANAGLASRCQARLCDYREISVDRPFDKIVSVGMFEHVGRAQSQRYFDNAYGLLKPGGVMLNHAVADQTFGKFDQVPTFITRYIFPDGELLALPETLASAERAGFEVRDVESLREHYWLTLQHWLAGLEQHHDEGTKFVGPQTYRIWRLFLAGASRGFEVGRQNLFQTLLVKPDKGTSGLPLRRADWYRS